MNNNELLKKLNEISEMTHELIEQIETKPIKVKNDTTAFLIVKRLIEVNRLNKTELISSLMKNINWNYGYNRTTEKINQFVTEGKILIDKEKNRHFMILPNNNKEDWEDWEEGEN